MRSMKTCFTQANIRTQFALVMMVPAIALAGCGVRPILAPSKTPSQNLDTVGSSSSNHAPTLSSISTLGGASVNTPFTVSYAMLMAASNAADSDGDAISFRIEAVTTGSLTKGGSAVTAGTTLLSSGESLVWTPDNAASGNLNAFTVVAYDGSLASSTALQVVVSTTAPANNPPTLSTISTLAGASEDTAFTISYAALAAAANEADPDGDAVSFRVEAVSTGTLTKGGSSVTAGSTLLSSGESLVWTPAANANGNLNAFTVKAHDGSLASSSAVQVVVSTSAVNDVPTLAAISTLSSAVEDTAFTISYATLAAAADEADVDGDAISFRVDAVSTGTLTKGGSAVTAGSTLLSSGESLVWTPAAGANGNLNAFTVKAHDGTAASASAVQVVVSTSAVNDVPTLTAISNLSGATEDTLFTISYATLAAAADEADPDGDAISFRIEAVSSGTLLKGGSAVTPGTTVLSNGESLSWTPDANANGNLNAFTVKAHDGSSASATAIQVVVATAAVADAPTLTSINTLSGATENAAFTISYATLASAANEADADGDAISFRIEAVSTGTLTKGGSAVTAGSTLLSSGESLVWTPDTNANGNLNAFTVKAYDGGSASSSAIQVVVNVGGVNSTPTLTTVSTLATATEDTAFTISYATLAAAADEADPDGDALSFRVEAVSSGNLTKGGSAVTDGVTLLSSGESWVWTPANNANGTLNAFTIRAYDGALASSSAIQVQVTVSAVNDVPTLSTISTLGTATEDTAFTVSHATLLAASNANDVEGDAISFRVEAVSTGTLTKGGSAVTAGTTLLSSGESLVWTPAANANGSLNAFTVKAHDGSGASASAIQVVVTTNAVEDAPTLTSISALATATEDTAFTITYAALAAAADDADAEGAAISFRVEAVSTGTLTKGGSAVTAGTTLLSSGESLVWTPASNANGTLNAFTVKAHDGSLASSSAIQVQVTTTAVNDVPTISAIDNQAVAYQTATSALAFTVGDIETAAGSLTLSGASSNTTLVPVANIVFGGSGASRTVTVTPASGQSGSATITVTVSDGTDTASETFVVVVNPEMVLESPIQLLGYGVGSSASSAITFARSKTFLDTGDFDGTVSYYFEINAYNGHASNTYAVDLVNAAGTAVASINVPPNAAAGYNRYRSTAFTPTAGLSYYRVRMPQVSVANDIFLYSARILVHQVGATKTRLYFPLASESGWSNGDQITAATADVTSSATYTQSTAKRYAYAYFQKDEAAYSQIASGSPWRFEAILYSTNAAATASVGLFEKATGNQVTGSDLNNGNTLDAVYVDLANNAANFTNLGEFEAKIKISNATYQAQLYKAMLSVKLENLTRGRIFYLVRHPDVITSSSVGSIEVRTLMDLTRFANPVVYFESTASVASAGDGILRLATTGTSDTGTSNTVITGSTLTPGTTRSRLRTGALSVTSGDRHHGRYTWTSGTLNHAGMLEVIDFGVSAPVGSGNLPPTLSTISTLSGASEDTPFTISYNDLVAAADEADLDGDAILFRIEAVSSGTLTKGGTPVIPGSTTITSGENVVWTPSGNDNGNLNAFSIRAYDGDVVSQSAVQVVVATTAVNDAPTISDITDQSTNYETATSAIAFTIGDVETAAASLTLAKASSNTTLVPTANIVFGGSGASRTVTVTPATGQYGTATITVTVDDGTTTTSDTFVLTVYPRMDLESPIEMLAMGVSSSSGGAITFARSKVYLDTADFDGTVSYFFEINCYNFTGSTHSVDLVNSSGTSVASISVASNSGFSRYRSAAFTPTAGLSHYRVKLPAATTDSLIVWSARIIVRQVGATKTRLYFPLLSDREAFNLDGMSSWVSKTSSTSYTQNWTFQHALFEKDESAYSEIASGTPWRFEAYTGSNNASGTAYVALFNKTTNTMVTGTELSSSTGDAVYVDFANNAANFTNLDQFETRERISNSSYETRLNNALLSVKLTKLSKGLVYFRTRLAMYYLNSGWGAAADSRVLLDLSRFINPTVYYETTSWGSVANSGTLTLETLGTNDTGTAGSAIAGTALTPTTTRSRTRTSAISITSGDRFWTKYAWSTGTLNHGGSFLVIQFGQ